MRRVVPIIIGSLLICAMAGAQQGQTGAIEGVVTVDGTPTPGVTVQAASHVLPRARITATGAAGEYRFWVLPPGDYELTFSLAGFATEQRKVPVHLQHKAFINVALRAARFEDEIVVTAETPTIDTTSARLKAVISDDVIESLPVGQQYRDLVKLAPGVQYTEDRVRGPSVGGSGQDNSYEFDGVSVSLPLYGTLSVQPSSHDIEEVVVVKGGANAVGFNRSGGMRINTLSKSGTAELRGEVSYQLQTDSMTAGVTADSETEANANRYWLTANVGGPIVPGLLHFFLSYYAPTEDRENKSTAYGEVPDYTLERDELFGKLSFTPTTALMLSGSWRTSETTERGGGVGELSRADNSTGGESTLRIGVLEGSWVASDHGLLSFKYSTFVNKGGTRPDHVYDFQPRGDGSMSLDIANLDTMGELVVPTPIQGEDAYNAFIAPYIRQYGFLVDGVPTGGGTVGGHYRFDEIDFFHQSFQVAYDHFLGNHELHVGYRWELGEEEMDRHSNGWGRIYIRGGLEEMADGTPVFFEAQVYQTSLVDDEGRLVGPLHSSIESQSFELNDVWTVGDFTINLGVMLSEDTLFGQGLKENSDNISGFEIAPGHKYKMYRIGFDETIAPRLSATWSRNGKDVVYASYARYYPAVNSLPRAASWDRNSAREIHAQFDAQGNLLGLDPQYASSGKIFSEGMKPRSVDEYVIGYDTQITAQLTGRIHLRHRRGQNFWEDTENNARSIFDAPAPISHDDYVPNLDEIRNEIGGSSYVIAELDFAYTKYYELGTEAEYRGDNFFVRGSYVWSHYYGNFDQDGTSTFNGGDFNAFIGSSYIADGAGRQLWMYREGNLRGDRRHQLKLYGYYRVPWNGTFGAYAIYQSGQPWQRNGPSQYYSGTWYRSRYAEPAGSRRSDSHYQVDLSYTQDIPIGDRYSFQVRGEVFNVTNNQTGYNISSWVDAVDYGEPTSWFDPRRFQLTVRFMY